eukprot:TRINITY_DN10917_c0_g1_i1.p1 TRINITY_DN10917_c0_g1~~TRINITY_DN10917_c0_g1_i1.p1  ORF type:complete len:715 (+),score=65.18 TRINITY_DN10917_c0_g1_i1:50-2146(+)
MPNKIFFKGPGEVEYHFVEVPDFFIQGLELQQLIRNKWQLPDDGSEILELLNAADRDRIYADFDRIPANEQVIVKRRLKPQNRRRGVGVTKPQSPDANFPRQLHHNQIINEIAPDTGQESTGQEEDDMAKLQSMLAQESRVWGRRPLRGMPRGAQRNLGGGGSGVVGVRDGYICRRCGQPGHHIKDCPTNDDPNYNLRKVQAPAGIPASELVYDPNGNYITPNGTTASYKPKMEELHGTIEGERQEQAQQLLGITTLNNPDAQRAGGAVINYASKIQSQFKDLMQTQNIRTTETLSNYHIGTGSTKNDLELMSFDRDGFNDTTDKDSQQQPEEKATQDGQLDVPRLGFSISALLGDKQGEEDKKSGSQNQLQISASNRGEQVGVTVHAQAHQQKQILQKQTEMDIDDIQTELQDMDVFSYVRHQLPYGPRQFLFLAFGTENPLSRQQYVLLQSKFTANRGSSNYNNGERKVDSQETGQHAGLPQYRGARLMQRRGFDRYDEYNMIHEGRDRNRDREEHNVHKREGNRKRPHSESIERDIRGRQEFDLRELINRKKYTTHFGEDDYMETEDSGKGRSDQRERGEAYRFTEDGRGKGIGEGIYSEDEIRESSKKHRKSSSSRRKHKKSKKSEKRKRRRSLSLNRAENNVYQSDFVDVQRVEDSGDHNFKISLENAAQESGKSRRKVEAASLKLKSSRKGR